VARFLAELLGGSDGVEDVVVVVAGLRKSGSVARFVVWLAQIAPTNCSIS
jgi:hypothetical protein